MTPSENAATEAAQTATENAAARAIPHFDNPSPEFGTATPVQDPPANDNPPPAERKLSAREEIAERHKAARQAEAEEMGEPTETEMGEFVPPWIAKQEAKAAEEAEAKIAAANKPAEPKTYTLKVRGNDIPVASRDELAKLAEVEDGEASDYTEAQLIKLAQKQIAANQILDEAKAAKKTARTSTREDEGNTQPQPEDDDDDQDQTADAGTPPQHQSKRDRYKALVEKVQFGDAEEAAEAFATAVQEGVKETVREQQLERRVSNVQNIIKKASHEFEAANADLIQDPDFSDIVYNKGFVQELKKDLARQGFAPENIERAVGNDLRSAMDAYVTIATDGRVKVRPPHQMFAAAAQTVRQKFGRPSPNPTTTNTPARPATPASHDRLQAKRGLTPQPNRASAPRAIAPVNGQSPAKYSNVVQQMRKQRGQG